VRGADTVSLPSCAAGCRFMGNIPLGNVITILKIVLEMRIFGMNVIDAFCIAWAPNSYRKKSITGILFYKEKL
jgi:hypothetical protein